jgi:hypothetical protein
VADPTIGFAESPFSPLADEESAGCWAGRGEVLAQLNRVRASWRSRSDSTLDLMWANLGAGKTHALLHLKWLMANETEVVPVFVELPEDIRDFHALYRLIVPLFPVDTWASKVNQGSVQVSNRVQRALRVLAFGEEAQRSLAFDWICGGRPQLKDLRSVTGLDSRIETDADAEAVFADLLRIGAAHGQRVVLLIDEFQRIGRLGIKRRDALLAHLRTLFSRNSRYFSVLLAVGSRAETTALELLPAELRTILGMRPAIMLPEMSPQEALPFTLERFAWFRPAGFSEGPDFPFSRSQLEFILAYLAANPNARMIPRTILQTLGEVFDAYGPGQVKASESELDALLGRLRWDETQR